MKSFLVDFKLFKVVLSSLAVFGLMSFATAIAQESQSQTPAKELVEKQLEPFAGAYKEVTQIHNTYEQRIVESSEQAQVNALQQEANDKMSKAVTNHGLTVEDYNKIFKTILNDPTLKEEFMTVLNQTP